MITGPLAAAFLPAQASIGSVTIPNPAAPETTIDCCKNDLRENPDRRSSCCIMGPPMRALILRGFRASCAGPPARKRAGGVGRPLVSIIRIFIRVSLGISANTYSSVERYRHIAALQV